MARMQIFNALEQNVFDSPPSFNALERKRFFNMPSAFNELINNLRTPTNKVCFVLSVGYFKARHQFFQGKFHQVDVAFIANRLAINVNDIQLSSYDRATYLRHQNMILNHFGFVRFDAVAKRFTRNEIARMIQVQFRPKLVFLEIVQVLNKSKIVLPSYNMLATMIVNAINRYQITLNQTIKATITNSQKEKLDSLLEQATGLGSDDKWRYQITLLKKPSQSTRPAKIKANVTDLKTLMNLYIEVKPVIQNLALSNECLRYYARSVVKSQVHQISRRMPEVRYLHLIAFIAYQTLKLQDMLIDTFLLTVQAAKNAADKNHKDTYYQQRQERNQSVINLVENLQKDYLTTVNDIKIIIDDAKLTSEQKVAAVGGILSSPELNKPQFEQKITDFKNNMKTIQQGQSYYELLESHSLKLQNRVADIMRQTTFNDNCGKPALLNAIKYYQKKSGDIDKRTPTQFLTTEQVAALLSKDGKFKVSLYKIFLYFSTADAIKSGILNLLHSEKYRPLDDYMIPKRDWDADREGYLQRAELSQYADCKATLTLFKQALEVSYKITNENFIAGDNAYLTLRADGSFHVATPKAEESEDSSILDKIFPKRKSISLLEALATIDQATGFLEELTHWQSKHQYKKPEKKMFYAGIIALGCDIEPHTLAQISKQINENELGNTINWHFSLSNIQNTNDRILQFMNNMGLPNIYRTQEGELHTSDDGQKVGVAVDSLNSNYSFKYLGKDKGVSVLSFIDMRHMTWYSTVISSAEREAAYVIDGLMHNDVIKSDIHSTDTHGYSEVVFAVTYLLGFTFAPRIKGLGHQQLYAFTDSKDFIKATPGLQPSKYIDEEIIIAQWDEILRFVATIKLKVTTASQLFRRLNSYSRQHPLYKALKELGRSPKTLFILKYVFDLQFRQSIEKQLNKGENANKLNKAISLGNEFIQGEKEDQDIAEGCRRLIKNVILCWNYLYLQKKIKDEPDEDQKNVLIESIREGSALRWSHFNFHGEFDFSDEKMADSEGLALPKKTLPNLG